MKILIYGSNGWIGGQFLEIAQQQNLNIIQGQARVNNTLHLEEEIKDINPTHVVSFIGRTHGKVGEQVFTTIDYLEQPGKIKDNVRDNLFSPLLLALICQRNNIHFTYLGTGCIFKFDDQHPFGQEVDGFVEESKPNFFGSSYSVVKGYTDELMHQFPDTVLNLRIRMPITDNPNPRNFITKITNYEYICSIPNSMTVLPELLPKVVDFMKERKTGTLNLTNPGLVSHNQILSMFQEIVDSNFTWKNFSAEQQNKILASERSNNFLETTLLQEWFPEVTNIQDSIRNCLLEYKNHYQPKINIPRAISQLKTSEYQCSNLLITGGCGFIGSNFINYYLDKNPDVKVINLDALYYCAHQDNVQKKHQLKDNYTMIKGNVCSSDLVTHILNFYEIDSVIHFAAQSHVCNSFEDSFQYTKDNIMGTHNLLECCRLYGKIKRFIHVSTDEVYGESLVESTEHHKTEQSILCPTNPYAATKAGAELIAQSYIHSFKMPIIITRGNNVYGPNQYPEKLIPKFIQQLQENKKVSIHGQGTSQRAFLHSSDTVRAFDIIMRKGILGEIYNIGCDKGMEYSVLEVAQILITMIKKTDNYQHWIEYIDDRPFNDQRYYISNQKLKNLGWDINIRFEDGLQDLLILSTNISREENPESTFKNNKFVLEPKSEIQEISEFFNENRKEKEANNVSKSISIF